MFNTFGSTTTTIGGGIPVWKKVEDKLTSGATLGILPATGSVLPAGTPVAVSAVGGTAYPIYFCEAATGALATATSLFIKAGDNYVVPAVGDKITVIDGQELTISVVGTEANDKIELTVTELTDGIPAGAILYLSEKDSHDISLANFAGLTENDVYAETGTTAASVAVVTAGAVYADRVPFVPFSVRNRIPNIIFEGGI
jgi:hypothetical protein